MPGKILNKILGTPKMSILGVYYFLLKTFLKIILEINYNIIPKKSTKSKQKFLR
jgi:hypothetical protein